MKHHYPFRLRTTIIRASICIAASAPVFAGHTLAPGEMLAWEPVGGGPGGSALDVIVANDTLIASSSLATLLEYQPQQDEWLIVGAGVELVGHALLVHEGDLIVGGTFFDSDDLNAIGRWNGSHWQPLGAGLGGAVFALASFEGHIIAGGNFIEVGSQQFNRIARWDGTQWHPMGEGFDDTVAALAVHDGDLYAGGLFTMADGRTVNQIARWDGDSGGWHPLGEGVNGTVRALGIHQGELHVGGSFSTAGGQPANSIARYDGRDWHPLGDGVGGTVRTMVSHLGELIVGTQFSSPNIRRWDGVSWEPMGDNAFGEVRALLEHKGQLIAGGVGNGAVAAYGPRIFHWNGGAGSFSSAVNWTSSFWQGQTPGSTDVAVFDASGISTVTFDESQTAHRASARAGLVTLDLNGHSFEQLNTSPAAPALTVGEKTGNTAMLTVKDGAIGSAFASIGDDPGTFGLLEMTDAATLDVDWDLWVGWKGAAILDVREGSSITTHRTLIAAGMGAFGDALVTGAGSTLTTADRLVVGDGGYGVLAIEDGANVLADRAFVGQKEDSVGTLTVSGQGASLAVNGRLDIGHTGHGEMFVENGAAVTVGDRLVLAAGATLPIFPPPPLEPRAVLNIRHAGSVVDAADEFRFGPGGSSELRLIEGGRLLIGSALFEDTSFSYDARINVELHDSGVYKTESAIAVGGLAELPDIEVKLSDSFVPQIGDRFMLVTASEIDYLGELILPEPPDMPDDLTWKVTAEPTLLEIEVIKFILGDLNGDGVVDVFDLILLITNWGPCNDIDDCPADLNSDGIVDVFDLMILINNWTGS